VPSSNEQRKTQFTFSSSLIPQNINNEILKITIDPCIHANKYKENSLETINKKWFVNFTQHDIPNIQRLLQLGQNVALPSLDTKHNIHQLIQNIENKIQVDKLHPNIQTEIRNRSIPLIHNLTSAVI